MTHKCKVECRTRIDTMCGQYENYDLSEWESTSGNMFSFIVALNPLTCGTATTNSGSANSMERASKHNDNYQSICTTGVQTTSCERVTIDGVVASDPTASDPHDLCTFSACPDLNGYSLVSTSTATDPCDGTTTTEVRKMVTDTQRCLATTTDVATQGYKQEYTTATATSRAKQCAMAQLMTRSLQNGDGIGGRAGCGFSIAQDASSASETIAKWRLRIEGTSADTKYHIELTWIEVVEGKARTFTEVRNVKGSDQLVWYYPSSGGELLMPKESGKCGYTYTKELIQATIAEK